MTTDWRAWVFALLAGVAPIASAQAQAGDAPVSGDRATSDQAGGWTSTARTSSGQTIGDQPSDAWTSRPRTPPDQSVVSQPLPPWGSKPQGAGTGARITWRVENSFRFFAHPSDTEVHRATYLSLSNAERRTPVLSAERALSERHPDGWAATMIGRICWNSDRNRHMCPGMKDYINPSSHSVIVELTGVELEPGIDCTWLTAPKGQRGKAITRKCGTPVELDIPYPSGAGVTVEVGGIEVAATNVTVTDLLVVGMGDSFGSGEGNPDLPVRFSRERSASYGDELAGYPARVGGWKQIGDDRFIEENARWADQACHRSLYSYQLRTALQIAIEDPHRSVTYVGVACSGAEVTQGLFLRYKGNEWVPNPPELSQISAVAQAQCGARQAPEHDLPAAYNLGGRIPELQGSLTLRKCDSEVSRKIDLLLLSVGGNDVGFSRLVANAVLSDSSLLRRLGGWFGQVHEIDAATDQLVSLDRRYISLNRALHNALHIPDEESDRVIFSAYPGLALLDDGATVCPDGRAGMDIIRDFKLSAEKTRVGSLVAEKLNNVMERAARQYGWSFVSAHRKAFLGRGICAGWSDSALSSADDLRLPRKIGGEWKPYNPADYRAYASRQRWFRTPNDAFLTGNFHVTPSLLHSVLGPDTVLWFQLVLASTYSGAFHPTAEGHAAMADAAVVAARNVLKKYRQPETEDGTSLTSDAAITQPQDQPRY